MAKYVYPAIFTKEDNGGYSIAFPDIQGCHTCSENYKKALKWQQMH